MERLGQNGAGGGGARFSTFRVQSRRTAINAGGKTFHKPGINLPWRAGSVERPDGGIVTPKFKGRKRNKNDFSWPNDEHEGKRIPGRQGIC
jgi:hypothetical protein